MTSDTAKTVNAKTSAPISSTPAIDDILSRVADNNGRLRDILTNAEAFLVRTLGEGRTEATSADAPQSQGKLPNIDVALGVQSSLLNDLRDTVSVLERIG